MYVERITISHEKGAEIGMLYPSKNMSPYSVGIRKAEVGFTQRSIKTLTNTEQDGEETAIDYQ
jgi:hypothetical protein